ncbi:trna phosphotransferase 1 [Moniliophthora roreri MCA 2997]|uniref:2'-phosphotransferase n=1 Tax=Moniliophthora roreri (strain MCA 2997) TaxID=1381753 RepID=V2WY86_MONRO|nr:trna phosphotransferase 1 [Moniliophthora roreri MCA 2997]
MESSAAAADSAIPSSSQPPPPDQKQQKNRIKPQNKNKSDSSSQPSSKLRGFPKDTPEARISKTLSWLLRHGAQSEKLLMRPDGFVKVNDLLSNQRLKSQNVDFGMLKGIVAADAKQRYGLISEKNEAGEDEWWIKANQGHSIKAVKLELRPILAISDIPSGVAIHGTDKQAWETISKQGLSKMKRNHIHLAQGLTGQTISGMRKSATVFIYVNVALAISDGIKFFLSDNGVVLSEGDKTGLLSPRYFEKVEVREKGAVRELDVGEWQSKDV